MEYIGDEVFSGCSNLTSINIPDSVISIGEETFCGCNQLDSVVIGKSVNSLGEGIFYLVPDENEESYQNLEKIVIKAQNPPYVRGEIVVGYSTYEVSRFYNTVTLEVPKGTLTAYRKSNTWNKFKNIKEFRDGTNINQETNADTKSRTVLLEYFTGQACVNSLDAHEMVTELHEEYQNNLIVVAIHAGKLAITAPTGLKQPEGDVYADNYGVKFYPNGLINRRGGLKFYPSWGTAVYEELQHESNLNLSVSSIVTEGKLTINTELLALEDVTGKLQLWITEDNIVGPQVSLTGADLQYVHNLTI